MPDSTSEFLLELFSEEIPAGLQPTACKDLQRLITAGLDKAGLAYGEVQTYATPRRLVLRILDVAGKSPDISDERKGPRVGAPEKALAGFLRGAGLDSIDQCETVSDKKGEFYVAKIEKPGLPAEQIFAELLPATIRDFPWPKSMRWGSGKLRWVRPLHSILALLGDKLLSFELDDVAVGDTTSGHRFMAPKPFKVTSFEDYEAKLRKARVMLRPDERRDAILQQADKIAKQAGLELVEDEALLNEAAGLVEWPTVLMGDFDEAFLEVPPEVLITSMKKHQKCFSLRDPKTGKLANRFLLVSNLLAEDEGKAIINGNERVIRARLSDAVFFWDQDRKSKLEDMAGKLRKIIFHERLGTQGERMKLVAKLAKDLAPLVGAEPAAADRAATLCKADLVSEMVGEFANLQGLMGRYYAEQQGESTSVAAACEEHYRPQGPNDSIPTQPISVAVALADKLNTLAGFWAIDEKPTGSGDPYALRRSALGVIRLILENSLRINLKDYLARAAKRPIALRAIEEEEYLLYLEQKYLSNYEDDENIEIKWDQYLQDETVSSESMHVSGELLSFFADRLKVYLRDKGERHDLIDAVFSLGGQDDLLMIVKRVEALGQFLETDDGVNLLAGIKRAENILRIEEKKDKTSYNQPVDSELLSEKAEKQLFDAITQMQADSNKALAGEDFINAMQALARLRAPVDAFFDDVTVNADDKHMRANRLALLSQIREATSNIADFSKIEG